jgi:hypothetical protein
MPINELEVEALAMKTWPHVASVSVQPIVAGRRRVNEFDPLESGFTLTACDAEGSILKRVIGDSLDTLRIKVEQQSRKKVTSA